MQLGQRREISITVKGRRTGKPITLPVWFVQEGERLYLLPVQGSSTQWLRNLMADPSITLKAGAQQLAAKAQIILDSPKVQEVANKFRARYGADQVARYYAIFDACVQVPLHP